MNFNNSLFQYQYSNAIVVCKSKNYTDAQISEYLINLFGDQVQHIESKKINFDILLFKRILLTGTSGSGKSLVSNILYNYDVNYSCLHLPFPVSGEWRCNTKILYSKTSNITNLTIIDTPGLNDNREVKIILESIYSLCLNLLEGVNCFMIICKDGRLSTDVINVLKILKYILDKTSTKLRILLITTWCDKESPKMFNDNEKYQTKINKFLMEEKEETDSYKLLKCFYDESSNVLQCSFDNDIDVDMDNAKIKRRIISRDLLFNYLFTNNSEIKIKLNEGNFISLLFNTAFSFVGGISESEAGYYFKAIHENYSTKLSNQFWEILGYNEENLIKGFDKQK